MAAGLIISSLIGLGVSAYAQGQKNKANRAAAKRMKDAYAAARELQPSEQKYLDRMQDRAETGDPNLGAMRNQVMGSINQASQQQQFRSQAVAIRSGLENSIIADELRRRVDRDTLQQMAAESTKLAMHNSNFKLQAQNQVDQFQLQRASMLRDLGLKAAGIASGEEINQSGWADWTQANASTIGSVSSGLIGSGLHAAFPDSEFLGNTSPGNLFTGANPGNAGSTVSGYAPTGQMTEWNGNQHQTFLGPDGNNYIFVNGQWQQVQ